MKPVIFLLASTAAVTLVVGCGTSAAERIDMPEPFSTASVKAELDSMNRSYHERFRNKTPAYFAERYTTDACVMAPRMPRICGLSGIVDYYWSNGENETLQLEMVGEEVSGTATEVSEVGSYRVFDDEGTDLDKGKYITIYRHQEGHWKVHREIWNSDLDWKQPQDTVDVTNQA